MSWFGSSSSSSSSSTTTSSQTTSTLSKPEASQDGGYIAPDRTARAQCWEGRDAFFQCLEKNGIIDSVREDEKARAACAPELKEFEQHCASSWVTYFKKRRVMEYQRDLTLKKLSAEGATPMDGSTAGGAGGASLTGR